MDNDLNEEELLKQEEYKRNLFGEELYQKIKVAEDDIKNNRVYNAKEAIENFKRKCGYYERNNIFS